MNAKNLRTERRMLFWSVFVVMVLAVGVAVNLSRPPAPEEAQVHSAGYANLLKRRAHQADPYGGGKTPSPSASSQGKNQLRLVSRIEQNEGLAIAPTASRAEKLPPTKSAALRPIIPPPDGGTIEPRPRGPASKSRPAYTSESLDEQNTLQAIELQLNCRPPAKSKEKEAEQTYRLPGNASQVRLSGGPCELSDIASSEIVNLTNHSSATVFFPQPGRFTTDYLTLSHGQNRLHVSHLSSDGKKEEHDYILLRAAN